MEPTSHHEHIKFNYSSQLILIGIGAVVLGVIIFLGRWGISHQMKTVPDHEIPVIQSTFTQMDKKLVHGQIVGKIQGSNASGRTISFCTLTKGEIVKQDNKKFLSCPKSNVKQVTTAADGTFNLRLLPGNYYLNIQLENGEQSADVPSRFTIKKSETTEVVIKISLSS